LDLIQHSSLVTDLTNIQFRQ